MSRRRGDECKEFNIVFTCRAESIVLHYLPYNKLFA